MKLAIIQPQYPIAGTIASAQECIDWIYIQLEALVGQDIDMVVLPEYSNCPGITDRVTLRKFIAGEGMLFIEKLAEYAKKLKCTIIAGLAEVEHDELKNRAVVLGNDGDRVYCYDKLHLTSAESAMGFVPGSEIGFFDFNGLKLGFMICFDVYFPEYSTVLTGKKIDLIICPSYQRGETVSRIEAMTCTRAIDTGAWVVRSSYAISKNSLKGGHSMIVSPAGNILADIGSEPGAQVIEFEPKDNFLKPASFGQSPVIHRDLLEIKRRPDVYRPAIERLDKYMAAPFPRLCAHRGLSLAMPENSIPAFAAALACGAHEIEFDLWLSADGVPVICHDPDMNRVAGVDMAVTESSWDAIGNIDFGLFKGEEWSGIKIARFEEVLDIAAGSFGMNIHIKAPGQDGSLVKMVGDLLKARGLSNCAYIAGDEAVLEAALSLIPEIPRACLAYQNEPEKQIGIALKYCCQRIQFFRSVADKHILEAKAAGMICNLFYSDSFIDAMNYINRGIDVILTNKAHQLIAEGFNNLNAYRVN